VIDPNALTFDEQEVYGIVRMLGQLAAVHGPDKTDVDTSQVQSRLAQLPTRARFTLGQALSAMAAQSTTDSPDQPMLLKLAEHVAIRFAMASYERGDIRVNSVQDTLERMSVEIDNLSKILGIQEEKMSRAGLRVGSHSEILAQQFWNEVGDDKKQAALLSTDGWCVPAHNIRTYLEKLLKAEDPETVLEILRNYLGGVKHAHVRVRRATASGVIELAPLYATQDPRLVRRRHPRNRRAAQPGGRTRSAKPDGRGLREPLATGHHPAELSRGAAHHRSDGLHRRRASLRWPRTCARASPSTTTSPNLSTTRSRPARSPTNSPT
jgi:hypothetical protein